MICLGVVFSIWIFLFAFLNGWPLDGDVAVTISWAFAERRCRGRSPCNVGPAASIPARINIAVNYASQFLFPPDFFMVSISHTYVWCTVFWYAPAPPPTSCNFGRFLYLIFLWQELAVGLLGLLGKWWLGRERLRIEKSKSRIDGWKPFGWFEKVATGLTNFSISLTRIRWLEGKK